jgi:hypothetical protein
MILSTQGIYSILTNIQFTKSPHTTALLIKIKLNFSEDQNSDQKLVYVKYLLTSEPKDFEGFLNLLKMEDIGLRDTIALDAV